MMERKSILSKRNDQVLIENDYPQAVPSNCPSDYTDSFYIPRKVSVEF